jgi:hypothetical protein
MPGKYRRSRCGASRSFRPSPPHEVCVVNLEGSWRCGLGVVGRVVVHRKRHLEQSCAEQDCGGNQPWPPISARVRLSGRRRWTFPWRHFIVTFQILRQY